MKQKMAKKVRWKHLVVFKIKLMLAASVDRRSILQHMDWYNRCWQHSSQGKKTLAEA